MRRPYFTLFLTAVTLAIAELPGVAGALTLSRSRLADGDFWQLWSAHFCHWTGAHMFWDLLVFGVLGSWIEHRCRRTYAMLLLAGLPLLSLSALALTPAIHEYRGLSGIDSALFGCVVVEIWRESKHQRVVAVFGTLIFIIKSVAELSLNTPIFVHDPGAHVVAVPAIHLAGFVVGVLFSYMDEPPREPQDMDWLPLSQGGGGTSKAGSTNHNV